MEKIIKEEEINILNLNMLRSQSVLYRIVDVMGTSKGTSRTEYVWDDESELQDNNLSVIKLENFEVGRYIRRIDPGMDSSDLLASNVIYDNSSSSLESTDLQDALDEAADILDDMSLSHDIITQNISDINQDISNIDNTLNNLSQEVSDISDDVNIIKNKARFTLVSTSSITVNNSTNPSIIQGFYLVEPTRGFAFESGTNSIINTTGKDLQLVMGTMALHAIQTSGGNSALLEVYSETSADGITWVNNPINLRQKTFRNDEVNFWGMPSGMINWKAGWRLRFRIFTNSNSTVMLVAPSSTVNGATVNGLSAVWTMEEIQ